MIEVKNLVKKYGDHTAVDHLSFHVDKGQIYGFLGPNGAGKSTTMNIMTGYIASTSGEVLIDGHNILEEPEAAKKCIGYLPEQPPLYFDMTVAEYLKFAAELKKVPKNERETQIEQVMELTGITAMANRLIKNLSKGYKQRVGLAQVITFLITFPPYIQSSCTPETIRQSNSRHFFCASVISCSAPFISSSTRENGRRKTGIVLSS